MHLTHTFSASFMRLVCFTAIVLAPNLKALSDEPVTKASVHTLATPTVIIARSMKLVDATNSLEDRKSIAAKVYDDPDRRYLPALVATLRDPQADRYLKYLCIYPLSRLPDKRIVDYLIEFIVDKDIGREADEQLIKILGVTMHWEDPTFDESEEGVRRRKIQADWREWWKEHRDKAPLFSRMAYTSDPLIFTSKEKYDPKALREKIEGK